MRLALKIFLVTLVGLFPSSKAKIYLLRRLGWEIGEGVRIGSIFLQRVNPVSLGKNTIIQSMSMYRDCTLVTGSNSGIGSWNWVSSAVPLKISPNYKGKLEIGNSSFIHSRNYFDVTGGVKVGNFSSVAGVRSTFLTHQTDTQTNFKVCYPITVGDYSMICSNSIIVPGGTKIGDRSVIAMGSVVKSGQYEDDSLYAGNPAVFKKRTNGEWFNRSTQPRVN